VFIHHHQQLQRDVLGFQSLQAAVNDLYLLTSKGKPLALKQNANIGDSSRAALIQQRNSTTLECSGWQIRMAPH
jgi:hypothetical protein